MTINLSEYGTVLIPDIPTTMTASTLVTSKYINTTGCEVVECILHLAASGSAQSGKIEVVAASDAAGTGVVAVTFKDLYRTIGAPAIFNGTGIQSRIEQLVGTVPTALASYDTIAADGDKQQLWVVPIRPRHMPSGKPYIAMRFTAGAATARAGTFMFIRRYDVYGPDIQLTSVFA